MFSPGIGFILPEKPGKKGPFDRVHNRFPISKRQTGRNLFHGKGNKPSLVHSDRSKKKIICCYQVIHIGYPVSKQVGKIGRVRSSSLGPVSLPIIHFYGLKKYDQEYSE